MAFPPTKAPVDRKYCVDCIHYYNAWIGYLGRHVQRCYHPVNVGKYSLVDRTPITHIETALEMRGPGMHCGTDGKLWETSSTSSISPSSSVDKLRKLTGKTATVDDI